MEDDKLLNYNEGENMEVTNDSEAKKGNYASTHNSGFRDLMLRPELARAITDSGFEHPSEVQSEAIPQAILGTDIICQAKPGVGKTAVFVLATLQQIQPFGGEVAVLVLCHTHELAFQIGKEYERFSKYMPSVKIAVFFGGLPIKHDEEILKNESPNIVVGTPGRVYDLIKSHVLKLKGVNFFVIDECDKVIGDEDMRRDVISIFKKTPEEKQVMMFSATLSKEIRTICKEFMHSPFEIYVDDTDLTPHSLQQYYLKLSENEKNRKLFDLLDNLEFDQVVIFVKSVERCIALNSLLNEQAFPSTAIHRNLKQQERIACYQQFKNFDKRILVATDLFGRGIDVERVNIVINYDVPEDSDSYLHRVARAGRFNKKGLAVTFVSIEEDAKVLNDVQDRFDVTIDEMPAQLDFGSYLEKYDEASGDRAMM